MVRLVARAEQEVRAYPRAHDLFYRLVTRDARVRAVAGRAMAVVRRRDPPVPALVEQDAPAVRNRRRAAVAERLGLDGTAGTT